MNQKDIERFAFLYLCGKKDQDLLLGRQEMTFEEFDRLVYLTDYFGLEEYNLELWNQFGDAFREEYEAFADSNLLPNQNQWRVEAKNQDQWLADFYHNIDDGKVREVLLQRRN